MKYLSIKEMSERWGISTRRIQILCKEGRIPGIILIGRTWGIPEDAEKPADGQKWQIQKIKDVLTKQGGIVCRKKQLQ